jgi:hypothetical protein
MGTRWVTATYYTVTPVNEDGTLYFDSTFRSSTKAEALENRRVFAPVYGQFGWTPVVKHTVKYVKGDIASHHGKAFSIARYAQKWEKHEIVQATGDTAPGHRWSLSDNRYVAYNEAY